MSEGAPPPADRPTEPPPPLEDGRTLEELQREKIMLEMAKLRADVLAQDERLSREREAFKADRLAQDKRLKREGWELLLKAVGGAAALFAAAAAFLKLIE